MIDFETIDTDVIVDEEWTEAFDDFEAFQTEFDDEDERDNYGLDITLDDCGDDDYDYRRSQNFEIEYDFDA